jgi:riboflavin kinase/FMN adenylyltransferase
MKIYYNINDFNGCNKSVVTLGTFDGVHVGHKQIINRLIKIANEENGESVVITFNPHPRLVLFPEDNDLKLLSDLQEKITLFQKSGIQHLIIHPFTLAFSRLTTTEFVRDLLISKINTHYLVIGYDHRLGRNREGSLEQLRELESVFDFKVIEIPKQEVDHVAVSSTKIRHALLNGDIQNANRYLGYNYSITGKVVSGNKIGKKLDFPTANIQVNEPLKLIPGVGVYAVYINYNNNRYGGMLNIGYRPTFYGRNLTIEVHIFNFNKEIYNETLTVELVARIRDEKKFDSADQLKKQLFEDREYAIELLNAL